jgi:phage terminase small subunit
MLEKSLEIPDLTRRQQKFILALISGATHRLACSSAGISEMTGHRYLALPHVQHHFRAYRRQVVENAISEMQSLTGEAVACLRKQMNGSNAAASVRAAGIVIQRALEGIDLYDLAGRVERLEKELAGEQHKK